jgi:hypothetical protein
MRLSILIIMVFFFHMMIPLGQCIPCSPSSSHKLELDKSSVVLITGAAGFVGSELAMALFRVYQVQHLILIDSMDMTMNSYGTKLIDALSSSNRRNRTAAAVSITKTRQDLALMELQRQRIFHVLQTLGSAATFYRVDLRPTLPEYFDIGQIPTLDYIMTVLHPNITHVVHLADAYHPHDISGQSFSFEPTNPQVTQVVPRIKEHPKAGMMETMLEQLYKIQQQQQQENKVIVRQHCRILYTHRPMKCTIIYHIAQVVVKIHHPLTKPSLSLHHRRYGVRPSSWMN